MAFLAIIITTINYFEVVGLLVNEMKINLLSKTKITERHSHDKGKWMSNYMRRSTWMEKYSHEECKA